jgi:hypothetical protein
MRNIVKYQKQVLKVLSGRIDDFYLAGGTALSLFYFQHRLSVDLDFFTQDFDYEAVKRTAAYLGKALKKRISLAGQNLGKKTARIVVYNIHFSRSETMKIDFVEDTAGLLKQTKTVDGIRILSLEDIYLRKLYALAGMIRITDETGRDKFIGGRAEAKDFYDIYFLSHTFMPLSKFVIKYCSRAVREAAIRWFRTFDRMAMMDGALMLDTNKAADYKGMEKHFKKEIDKVLEYELGRL